MGASHIYLQAIKNPPAVQELQETQVWSLGREDPLEEVMTTHPSILGWRIPWIEEPGGLLSIGLQRVGDYWSDIACTRTHTHTRTILLNMLSEMHWTLGMFGALFQVLPLYQWNRYNWFKTVAGAEKVSMWPSRLWAQAVWFHISWY